MDLKEKRQINMDGIEEVISDALSQKERLQEKREIHEKTQEQGRNLLPKESRPENVRLTMMCEKPYIRCPDGVHKNNRKTLQGRLASTPFPCGRCLPCKINKARIWTHRMLLEQTSHDYSSFVTLTYEKMPPNESLQPEDFTKFLKRLRINNGNTRIRYFGVGEYGEQSERPHYHAALFGVSFLQKEKIEKAWSIRGKSLGHVMVGDLTKDSARYMTEYIVKNMNFASHKSLNGRCPEYSVMSKKNGGLGYKAIKKIAETLKSSPYYENKKIIREIVYGKNEKKPLGRYLTRKLAEELGYTTKEFYDEFIDYTEKIFDEHMDCGKVYYESVVQELDGKRKSQKRKKQIFKKRRNI